MKTILLAVLLAFQGAEPKPLIDNARVRVWEGRAASKVFEFDTLTVSSTGAVKFYKAGSNSIAEKEIIEFKPGSVKALPNTTGLPLAMPRPGAKKILDNARFTAWDYTWVFGVATPMHFHDKDVVVMFLEEGDLKSTTVEGTVTVNQWTPGTIRFNARDRAHNEELVQGKQRAIIVELK
ncbi:MAG: hypothetical protein ABIR70_17345 [Bryobacteraceae bacterium]